MCTKSVPKSTCLKLPALLSSLARFTMGDSGAVASLDSSGESGGTGDDVAALNSDGESGVVGLSAASAMLIG